MNRGVAIHLNEVTKAFADRTVLNDFHLSVSSGDFIAVVGPSGCGKSTLLRLIAGLEKPQSGTVGLDPHTPRIGYVFQEPHLLPWRTVADNVRLPLELQKSAYPSNASIQSVLARVGLEKEGGRFPGQLSGGMRMRVSLARALITQPNLLLLDEPFAALDEAIRLRLEEDLRRLWQDQKITIVFVTHSFSEAVFLSNRIVFLPARSDGTVLSLDIPLSERDEALRGQASYAALVLECRRRFESLLEAR